MVPLETPAEVEFKEEFELFRREVEEATQHFYGYLSINSVSQGRRPVLKLLNEAATLWNTANAAFQVSAVITLHRVFDTTSKHNVYTLLRLMEQQRETIFSREALANRKLRHMRGEHPSWLDEYVAEAYVPTAKDFRALRKQVAANARIYAANYKAIRDKIFAHREVAKPEETQALYSKTNIRELQKIFAFLNQMYKAILELLENGRRPVLRPTRYSVASIRKNREPGWYQRGVQQIIVHEVDDFFDAATRDRRHGKRPPR